LKKFGVVRVDGRKSATARQKSVDEFISNSNVRVFIGNIQAAGTGLDGLQKVCSRCYFAEPDWVPAQNEQAVSRLDRLGQEELVNSGDFCGPWVDLRKNSGEGTRKNERDTPRSGSEGRMKCRRTIS
jgi:hypothetical protein